MAKLAYFFELSIFFPVRFQNLKWKKFVLSNAEADQEVCQTTA